MTTLSSNKSSIWESDSNRRHPSLKLTPDLWPSRTSEQQTHGQCGSACGPESLQNVCARNAGARGACPHACGQAIGGHWFIYVWKDLHALGPQSAVASSLRVHIVTAWTPSTRCRASHDEPRQLTTTIKPDTVEQLCLGSVARSAHRSFWTGPRLRPSGCRCCD